MKRILLISLLCFVAYLSNAQDLIITHSDEMIRAFNLEIGQNAVFYTLEDDSEAQVHKIDKADIFIIKKADGSKIDLNESLVIAAKETTEDSVLETPVDLSDFHGYLMGRGCNVFVTSNAGLSYEQPAVDALKRALKARNYWNVVETVEAAHFVIQFGVCTKGEDRAFIYARTRDSYSQLPSSTYNIWTYKVMEPGSLMVSVASGSEDGQENAALVQRMAVVFNTFEIEDDDPVLSSLKEDAMPEKSSFPNIRKMGTERVRGTVPVAIMWQVSSKKTFWECWSQFYVQ